MAATEAPEWAAPQVQHPEYTVDVDPQTGNVALTCELGPPAMLQVLSITVNANAAGYRLVDHSKRGDQLTFAPGGGR